MVYKIIIHSKCVRCMMSVGLIVSAEWDALTEGRIKKKVYIEVIYHVCSPHCRSFNNTFLLNSDFYNH